MGRGAIVPTGARWGGDGLIAKDHQYGKQGSHLPKVLLQRVHTDSPVREVRPAGALPLQALLGGLQELVLLGAASGAGGAREDSDLSSRRQDSRLIERYDSSEFSRLCMSRGIPAAKTLSSRVRG